MSARHDLPSLRQRLAHAAVHALALVALAAGLALVPDSARAEGSWQFGIFEGIAHDQLLRENVGGDYFRLHVDILAPGEVVNVHLCGTANTSNISAEMLDSFGGSILDVDGASRPTRLNSSVGCTDDFDTTWDPTNPLRDAPFQFVAPSAGTYELRLRNENGSQMNRFDITVTDDVTDPIDPRLPLGRIWADQWNFNTGTFNQSAASNADLYVVTDGGFIGKYAIWQLDLNEFNGYIYDLKANSLGVDSPNAAGDIVAGISVPTSGNSLTAEYPIYASYPAKSYPLAVDEIIAENFRFLDDQGQDASISPGGSANTQDTGKFYFETNTTTTAVYEIVIDIGDGVGGGPDGIYGQGDVFLLGTATNGTNEYEWDGKDNSGNPVPQGFYTPRLRVRVGEFHFVGNDVEYSGYGGTGIKINQALSTTTSVPAIVFWDDFTVQGDPNGFNIEGIYDGDHAWGYGTGDIAFIDTFAYAQSTAPQYIEVGVVLDDIPRPSVQKSFAPATIVAGSSSTLSIAITNNDTAPITGVNFTDPLPAGMTVASDPTALVVTPATCTDFAASAGTTLGGTQFDIVDGTIPAGETCTVEIEVTASLTNQYENTASGVTSAEAPIGPGSNTANLRVIPGASGPGMDCDATWYASAGTTSSTRLYRMDRDTGPYALSEFSGAGYAPTTGYAYDALGFNPVDGYLYAIVRESSPGKPASGSLLRIEASGEIANLGEVLKSTATAMVMPQNTTRFVGGAFGEDGKYYVVTDSDAAAPAVSRSRIVTIDVFKSRPEVDFSYSHGRDVTDIAMHPDGTLYAIDPSGQLFTIDPTDGSTVTIGSGALGADPAALFADSTGRLVARNGAGGLVEIDPATGAGTALSSGPAATAHDGASCAFGVTLEKRAVPGQAVAGGTVGYEFTLYNASDAPIGFSLADTLDAGRTFIADTLVDPVGGNANAYGDTDTLQISGLTIPAKGSATLSIDARIPLTAPIGSLLNQATLGGASPSLGGDTPSDDPATAAYGDPTSVDVIGKAVIGVAKKASINPFNALEVIMDFRLDNLGTVALTDVSLPDDLDAVLGAGNYSIATAPIFVPGEDPGTLTLNGSFSGNGADTDLLVPGSSTLAAGATALIRFVVLVDAVTDQGYGVGTYRNQVTATGTDPLGGIHSDLSDSGELSDTDGDGDPTESIADGGDSDENDDTVFAVTEPLGDPPPPVSINKLVEDVNGGDVEPGDTLRYTLNIANSQPTAVVDLTVSDDMPPLLNDFTLIAAPIGSTAVFTPPPGGAEGNGVLTVSDLDIAENTSADIVFETTVDQSAGIGTPVRNTAGVDYPAGDNDSDEVTSIVYAPFAPAAGTKLLYMTGTSTLSRTPLGADPATVNVGRANSRTWTLSPSTTDTLNLTAGTIPVELWLTGTLNEDYPLRVTLTSVGATAAAIGAEVSQTVQLDTFIPTLVRFDIALPADVTLDPGSAIRLRISNDNPANLLTVHPRNGTHSLVAPETDTVIRVDAVETFDAPYPAGTARDLWFADDTLQVRAEVADPFGQADISGATMSVRDTSGATVFGPVSMGAPVTNTAGTRTFEAAYTLPSAVAIGTWRVIVTAEEGTEGTVTHSFFRDFQVSDVPVDFGDAPDALFGTAPGDYRTRLADDGPRHQIVADLHLGAGVDAELDGFVDGTDSGGDASDDDLDNGDDEDGVTFPLPLASGTTVAISVQSVNGGGASAYLNAWIDFDGDGSFAGPGEQIATDRLLGTATTSIDVAIPEAALIGPTFARFRYSTQSGLASNGFAPDGEVEDHAVEIVVPGYTVSGRVFDDGDVDGAYDAGESGIAGVTIVLRDITEGTCASVRSQGDGQYAFYPVLPGDYTVHESSGASVPVACPPFERDPGERLSITPNAQALTVVLADVANIDFADVREPILTDEGTQSAPAGGGVVYPHVFTAYADGTLDPGVSAVVNPSTSGWTHAVHRDTNCNGRLDDGTPAILAPFGVVAGERVCLLVRVGVPANAASGARHVSTLTASYTFADPSGLGHGLASESRRVDVTTAVAAASGRLVLEKFVENLSEGGARTNNNAADTGDVLRYSVTFENAGRGAISDLQINDATPAFTSIAAPVACPGSLPASLTGCTVQVPIAGNNTPGYEGPIEWRFGGILDPGARGELSFDVAIE